MTEYTGNRLNCNECKFCPKMNLADDNKKYTSCKLIDHNKIRLYTKLFNGYDGSIRGSDICKYYEPASWNLSSQKEYKGIDIYIEFMIDWHGTIERLKNIIYVTLCVGGIDCYGEFQYHVGLYDWLTANFLNDNKLKYISKYKVERTPSGKPKGKVLIDKNGIDDISQFLK